MDLLKRNVHMNRKKSNAVSQLTLDDDYNVPDIKPDVGRVIQTKGIVKIEDVQVSADHVLVSGNLEVKVLYIGEGDSKTLHSLEGILPFEENINLDGVVNGDNIRLKWEIEDLSTTLINSRKLNMKALISFKVSVEEIYDVETTVDMECDQEISRKHKSIDTLQMSMNKKDTYRIKEEISLASNKPNIHEILWESLQLRGTDVRVENGSLEIKGELFIFVLYTSEDENNTIQWVENALPFSGKIECSGSSDDMISNIDVDIMNSLLEVRPDYDGEERVIQVDVVLELDMRFYEESSLELLQDVYTPVKDMVPVRNTEVYESLLVKNSSKCKINERSAVENTQDKMLQICHSEGEVSIDDVRTIEDGIMVEGAVKVQILYITSDDTMPFYSMEAAVPFEHVVEAPGIDENVHYYLKPSLEQLSTTMLDSEEIEIKAVINLEALVIRKQTEQVITDVKIEDLDLKKMQELPGIVGYIVQPDDTLWDIAKQFYTTTDTICKLNEVDENNVKPGDRLIIMKSMDNMVTK